MIIKQTENIYYLPCDEETDRPVLGYISGKNRSLMIDAGSSKRHCELFFKLLKELNLKYPDYVVLTHYDWDHSYGLHSIDSISFACTDTNNQLKKMMSWKWTDQDMKNREINGDESPFCNKMIKKEYPNRDIIIKMADIEFEKHLKIDLGGISCELFKVNEYHTKDSVVIYIPEEKYLFLGDCIYASSRHNDETKQKLLKDLIYTIEKIDFNFCIIGHEKKPITKEILMVSLKKKLSGYNIKPSLI
ncbi:MAG TPA: MBL fold metallo-hydrolase [Gallicola sp.]|jgi:glyoxylase-like metal-dependent hydrolase (beta-lactamase superfamily II)|nr:MBL fold metallo-hydrolase [Gallicola sp.]